MDGLLYAVQQGTAKLVLCALPSESSIPGRKKSNSASATHKVMRTSLASSATGQVEGMPDVEDSLLDVVPAGDSPAWKAICRAFAQHGFRLPGKFHSETQCDCFLVLMSKE
jgi:hypothetical protein